MYMYMSLMISDVSVCYAKGRKSQIQFNKIGSNFPPFSGMIYDL